MAAALLLTACGKTNAGSGSSGSMSGSSGTSSAQTQTAAWKTGLGVVTEATDQDRAGKIELAAAAVLLDGEGNWRVFCWTSWKCLFRRTAPAM